MRLPGLRDDNNSNIQDIFSLKPVFFYGYKKSNFQVNQIEGYEMEERLENPKGFSPASNFRIGKEIMLLQVRVQLLA
jgi:hypothetical protein